MNQILDYNPNKKGNSSSGSDKIVRVFAVILIIFAIVLIASGAWGVYKRNQENKKNNVAVEKPVIEVTQEETEIKIKVTHTIAIEKIIYSWNNGKETVIKAEGETEREDKIPLPAGNNTLHVKVTDIEGQETTYEGQFTSESGTDILNPIIDISVDNDTKKVVIVATDETSLDFVTYRWNNEEEETVQATEDNPKEIRLELEILKGSNDLTIIAVDSNNNTTTEMKNFTGLTKPEITITVSDDKTSADIYIVHENGIQEVKLKVNGEDVDVSGLAEGSPKEISFNMTLPEGDNTVIVSATSTDSTETEVTEEISNHILTPEENLPGDTEQTDNPEETPDEVNKPEISIEKNTSGETAHATIHYENGIKEIKLNINDVDYDVNGIGDNPIDLELNDLPLAEGNNRITLTVITSDGQEEQSIQEIYR